ncbi:hypothetical protein UCDDS831_g07640 [Diplodia seriata]|uniref:Uncharacterized protein n=1 Tax=Diplodia seriata TaxID=420778 RepID=A0A0G2DWZ7_9PEZI|nr:hypothetical protein UCDDS831_g07640 [Diplodia seriata]
MLPPMLTPPPTGTTVARPTLPPILSTPSPTATATAGGAGASSQATCGNAIFQDRFTNSNHSLVALDREAAADVLRQLQFRDLASGNNTQQAGSVWIAMDWTTRDPTDVGRNPWARVEVKSPKADLPALPQDGKLTSTEMGALQDIVEACGGQSGGKDVSGRIVGSDGRTWELFAERVGAAAAPAPPPVVTKAPETTTATTATTSATMPVMTPNTFGQTRTRTWSPAPKQTGELEMTLHPPPGLTHHCYHVRGLPLPKAHMYREAERVCYDEGANVILPGGKFVHEQQAMDRQMMDSIFYRFILFNKGTEPYVVKQTECKHAFWRVIDDCAHAHGMFGGWRKIEPDLMFIIQDANSAPKDRYKQPKKEGEETPEEKKKREEEEAVVERKKQQETEEAAAKKEREEKEKEEKEEEEDDD